MRVALVHDWLTGMRGGERVLESLLGLFPTADIFTLVHVAGSVAPAIEARPIRTSFVLATGHCVAVGARAPTSAGHLVYCFTPMRYAWTFEGAYVQRAPALARG